MPTGHFVRTKEHCKKIGDALRGKKLSEAHKQALRDNHADLSGEKNGFYGKTHTLEVRMKISQRQKDKKQSKETLQKRSDSMKKNLP